MLKQHVMCKLSKYSNYQIDVVQKYISKVQVP